MRLCHCVSASSDRECGIVRRPLMTGVRSEKCVVGRFRRRVNVIECTYINLDSTAYYTPRQFGIA